MVGRFDTVTIEAIVVNFFAGRFMKDGSIWKIMIEGEGDAVNILTSVVTPHRGITTLGRLAALPCAATCRRVVSGTCCDEIAHACRVRQGKRSSHCG
jgi:hypothetical protein